MQDQPTLLFYCQHSLGMGHLIRSFALAETMMRKFRVVFLNGGHLPKEIRVPDGLEIIDLPSLSMAMSGALTSAEKELSIHDIRTQRRKIMLETVNKTRPEVIFIELFPFGRKKFAVELLPMLEEARKVCRQKPVTVCSLRDILVGGRRDQAIHDVRASLLANHYFDAILVHADEKFVRLEETFQPRTPLETPVHYTGFVTKNNADVENEQDAPSEREGILVSAGGGVVGGALFKLALQTHDFLWPELHMPMTLITGPFLPPDVWMDLENDVALRRRVSLKRYVPDLQAEMRKARVSISQCGYNTTMDILRTSTPSVVVPFYLESEDEQLNRARRLDRLGLVTLVEPQSVTPEALADAVWQKLNEETPNPILSLGGAEATLDIVEKLLLQRRRNGKPHAAPSVRENWLTPVRKALDEAEDKVIFFFRDDDAGWEDKRLSELLSLIEHFALPLDMAVIPNALSANLVDKLSSRAGAAPDRLGLHQHGFSHTNHEEIGRKCEFGKSRGFERQFHDIRKGRDMLHAHFGDLVQPIFTPPWNRCTEETAQCLRDLGFKILSRDRTAPRYDLEGLSEIPIHVDWFAKKKGKPLSRVQIGGLLAEEIRKGGPVGVMFHHAEMDEAEQTAASEVLFLLATHGNAKCRGMMYVAKKLENEARRLQKER